MKRFVLVFALVGMVFGAWALHVSQHEDVLQNGAFEESNGVLGAGWVLSGNFKVLKNGGHNGNGGLVWEASKRPGRLYTARQRLRNVRPGDIVRASALAKKEDFHTDGAQGAVMSIEWQDASNKWIKAVYALTPKVADCDWTPIACTGIMPANATHAVMVIYVSGDSYGKVSFDNVTVTKATPAPVQFVTTTAYRNFVTTGKVGFHAALTSDPARDCMRTATFVWRSAAGEQRRTPAARLVPDEVSLELDAAELAYGTQEVTCELFENGQKCGASSVTITHTSARPKRYVEIDEYGRCLVRGKPFFPIGMYWNPSPRKTTTPNDTRTQLDWFTNGPFNCSIHYEMISRARLDACQKAGIMSIYMIDSKIVQCVTGRFTQPYTQAAAEKLLADYIASVQDHPALLGWYIGDEVDAGLVDYQRRMYRLITQYDPHHPIYGVQDRTYDLRPFTDTMDVLGLDSYPVSTHPLSTVTKMMREGQAAMLGTRPIWGVPQVFDWTWYGRPEGRFPSLAEIRSMNWQYIAAGAKGLFFFAFNCYFYPRCTDDWRPRFALACEGAREVARLSDVLLSIDPAPKGKIEGKDAICRTWAKDGKAYLLVCNLTDTPRDVKVALSSGAWRMDATEVGTPGVMADLQHVAFYLDAWGVSLVRLSPR